MVSYVWEQDNEGAPLPIILGSAESCCFLSGFHFPFKCAGRHQCVGCHLHGPLYHPQTMYRGCATPASTVNCMCHLCGAGMTCLAMDSVLRNFVLGVLLLCEHRSVLVKA